ncbi:hypothetical protein [Staphylococcus equorum]|uniref:hypothetical protein n=1 Tax=Staphylococcus equorum TaxID=246432 RepID=UPI000852D059|nr:hypothetical protein [Staphylococcus equorum]OEK60627.1 hypothetical protein ASS99_11230 [Staphylococcus equorum]
MKKITTNLKLKGMQKRLTESYGNLGRYEHYQDIGFDFPEDIKGYKLDVEKYENMLSKYRVDVVLLKANNEIRYSK